MTEYESFFHPVIFYTLRNTKTSENLRIEVDLSPYTNISLKPIY